MGTDIHIRMEVRRDGVWHAFPMDGAPRSTYTGADGKVYDRGARIENRNYDVFAILGNVRNGYGFAGLKTGDGFPPISDRRGLPADIAKDHDEWDFGDHSKTWVTLDEVLAYPWDESTTHCGWVDAQGFLQWQEEGSPHSYSGGISGSKVRKVGHDQMRQHIIDTDGAPPNPTGEFFITFVEWKESYREAGKPILDFTEWALRETGARPEDIRLVFGFDS